MSTIPDHCNHHVHYFDYDFFCQFIYFRYLSHESIELRTIFCRNYDFRSRHFLSYQDLLGNPMQSFVVISRSACKPLHNARALLWSADGGHDCAINLNGSESDLEVPLDFVYPAFLYQINLVIISSLLHLLHHSILPLAHLFSHLLILEQSFGKSLFDLAIHFFLHHHFQSKSSFASSFVLFRWPFATIVLSFVRHLDHLILETTRILPIIRQRYLRIARNRFSNAGFFLIFISINPTLHSSPHFPPFSCLVLFFVTYSLSRERLIH